MSDIKIALKITKTAAIAALFTGRGTLLCSFAEYLEIQRLVIKALKGYKSTGRSEA